MLPRKRICYWTFTGALSFLLLITTLLVPHTVESQSDLEPLHLGWPLHFVAQDMSRYSPIVFPQKFSLGGPWESPIRILWDYLLASYLFIFIVVAAVMRFFRFILK